MCVLLHVYPDVVNLLCSVFALILTCLFLAKHWVSRLVKCSRTVLNQEEHLAFDLAVGG